MKLYTFYSESHKELYENYFLESFNRLNLGDDFELDATIVSQKGNGDFGTKGFKATMVDKIEILFRAVEENPDQPFVFADCDIQFFENFHDDILTHLDDKTDMVAQSDNGTICAGLFIARGTKVMKKFLQHIHKVTPDYANEQVAMNVHKGRVRYKLLPQDKYFTIAMVNGAKVWEGETNYDLPKNIMVHHANFTIGVPRKAELFEYVREQMKTHA
jgi:hypothetical protein